MLSYSQSGVNVMLSLACANAIEIADLHWTRVTGRSNAAGSREPIRVQVHVRDYADTASRVGPAYPGEPDLGRMPVGSLLDCYM